MRLIYLKINFKFKMDFNNTIRDNTCTVCGCGRYNAYMFYFDKHRGGFLYGDILIPHSVHVGKIGNVAKAGIIKMLSIEKEYGARMPCDKCELDLFTKYKLSEKVKDVLHIMDDRNYEVSLGILKMAYDKIMDDVKKCKCCGKYCQKPCLCGDYDICIKKHMCFFLSIDFREPWDVGFCNNCNINSWSKHDRPFDFWSNGESIGRIMECDYCGSTICDECKICNGCTYIHSKFKNMVNHARMRILLLCIRNLNIKLPKFLCFLIIDNL